MHAPRLWDNDARVLVYLHQGREIVAKTATEHKMRRFDAGAWERSEDCNIEARM